MPTRKPKPHGRSKFEPTAAQRNQVVAFVLADADQAFMARYFGISKPTFRRAFRKELDTGYLQVKAEIVAKAVTLARGGSEKMIQFYLECHGWVRSERLVVADGGVDDSDVSALSDEQIMARLAVLKAHKRKP